MSLNERINKIKITLFGNVWITRIAKLILYSSVILVAWFISKSESLFPGASSPWIALKSTLNWQDRQLKEWLSVFFSFSFFALLVFAYFWILSIFVRWLTRIEVSPRQQIKIIEKKAYESDDKLSYKVEKINNLKVTVFRGSPYVSLTGSLLLSNEKQKKTVNFVCCSHSSIIDPYLSPSSLETHFPQTKIQFKQKSFFTWQKIAGIILLVAGSGFVYQTYKDGQQYSDQKLGAVVKSKAAIQQQLAEKKKKQSEEEERKEKLKEAKITDPKDIRGGFELIGGLREVKKQCENNADAILARNKNPNSLAQPEHMLLYGPPGTGKTFLAQAIAKRSGSFFLNLSGKDFKTSLAQRLGNEKGMDSQDKIRRVFDIAIQVAEEDDKKQNRTGKRTIVALIDEIDQMGEGGWRWETGKELLDILSGADSERYKNIVIIATTNFVDQLAGALLRSGRLSKKLLVNYPGPKNLKDITYKVATEFYDVNKDKDEAEEAFGSRSKEAFRSEFGKLMYEEMNKKDYALALKDIYGERAEFLPARISPDETRILFTGADAKTAFYESLNVMNEWGQKTLNKKHITEAVKRTFKNNKIVDQWHRFVDQFVRSEFEDELTIEDKRKMNEGQRNKGPKPPRG